MSRFPVIGLRLGVWLVVALFAGWVGEARADSCGQAGSPPVISVRTQIKPPTLDFTKGILELSAEPDLAVPRDLPEFKYATGATSVGTEREWNVQLKGTQRPEGGQCWWITRLQVTLTAHTKVFVAKEVPKDSCLWKEVMRHEGQHVKIDRTLFPRLGDTVRPRIMRQMSRSISAPSEAAAGAYFKEMIIKSVDSAIQAFLDKRNKAQLAIDNREEYTRANRLCGDAEIAAAFARAGIQ